MSGALYLGGVMTVNQGTLSSATHMLLLTSNRPSNTHYVQEKVFSFNVTFVKS